MLCYYEDYFMDEKIIEELREYLKDNYTPVHSLPFAAVTTNLTATFARQASFVLRPRSLRCVSDDASDYIKKNRKPGGFAHTLDRKRQEKGLKPAALYKKANIDRRQYSRYMGPEGRHPSMNTVICFGLALGLERLEFDELLQTAGYALSNSSSRDVCIMFCLEKGIYDTDNVNALLFALGIEPLARDIP